jgi:hypothetical protein
MHLSTCTYVNWTVSISLNQYNLKYILSANSPPLYTSSYRSTNLKTLTNDRSYEFRPLWLRVRHMWVTWIGAAHISFFGIQFPNYQLDSALR